MKMLNKFLVFSLSATLLACGDSGTLDDLANGGGNGNGVGNGGNGSGGCPLTVDNAVETATTWSCPTVNVTSRLRVLAPLSIAPGVEVVFASASFMEVQSTGSLTAVGTAAEPIVFRGVNSVKSFWGGIAISSNSADNQLRFVEIRDTGGSGLQFNTYGLRVTGPSISQGRLAFTDSVISNGGETGMFVDNGGILDEFARNTFEGIDGYPLNIQFAIVDDIDSSSSFAGGSGDAENAQAAVFLRPSDFVGTGTMDALDVPYVMGDNAHQVGTSMSAGNLSIAAGAELQFNGGFLEVGNGTLQAIGSVGNEILFTSFSGATEGWGGLTFLTNGDNRIENAIIENAGGSGFQFNTNTIIVGGGGLPSGTLTLSDTVLRNNGDEDTGPLEAGAAAVIRIFPGGTLNQSFLTFTNNEGPDIQMD